MNLKWNVAISAINDAVIKGANIYLPENDLLDTMPERLIKSVDDNGRVILPNANAGFGLSVLIANDYRLEFMYKQAQSFMEVTS